MVATEAHTFFVCTVRMLLCMIYEKTRNNSGSGDRTREPGMKSRGLQGGGGIIRTFSLGYAHVYKCSDRCWPRLSPKHHQSMVRIPEKKKPNCITTSKHPCNSVIKHRISINLTQKLNMFLQLSIYRINK